LEPASLCVAAPKKEEKKKEEKKKEAPKPKARTERLSASGLDRTRCMRALQEAYHHGLGSRTAVLGLFCRRLRLQQRRLRQTRRRKRSLHQSQR
jgi:hypothetical protein